MTAIITGHADTSARHMQEQSRPGTTIRLRVVSGLLMLTPDLDGLLVESIEVWQEDTPTREKGAVTLTVWTPEDDMIELTLNPETVIEYTVHS